MNALLVALLLSQAEVPVSTPPPLRKADAPVAVLGQTQLNMKAVGQFEPSPDVGCWMDSSTCQGLARANVDRVACQQQLALLKDAPKPGARWPWVVGALVVGAAAGAGLALAAQ